VVLGLCRHTLHEACQSRERVAYLAGGAQAAILLAGFQCSGQCDARFLGIYSGGFVRAFRRALITLWQDRTLRRGDWRASFGKMAILLFGLAGVLALISFAVLPAAPSLGGHGGGGDGHVVVTHDSSEDPAESANRDLAEARARRAAVPVDFGAGPADPNASPPADGSVSDELPAAGQERVPQQPGATPGQPAAPHAPQVQAAPQVTFVPGQLMVDTNPSR
jgi:hypothetical protein